MKTLVITHLDPDGILSARLLEINEKYYGREVDVLFPSWRVFSSDKLAEEVEFDNYETIFFTDLGTDPKLIREENALAEDYNIEVIHIDHHPTSVVFINDKDIIAPSLSNDNRLELNSNLLIIHNLNNCAAGLTYNYIKEFSGYKNTNKWLEIWATVGVYSDVATQTSGGSEIIKIARKENPELLGRWHKGNLIVPIPTLIGRYLNVPRKILFNKGSEISLKACAEIEKIDNYLTLFDSDLIGDVKTPNITKLKEMEFKYTKSLQEMLNDECYQFLDYITHGYCIFFHDWDIGRDLARLLSRKYQIPVVAINTTSDPIIINGRISVRKEKIKMDLGKIFEGASTSKFFVTGGGHPRAAACSFKKEASILHILSTLEKSFSRHIGKY